ncbi:MAG: transporter permease [Firmicutes bacterium]|nr:transporter permease [Bacillota bacterium]
MQLLNHALRRIAQMIPVLILITVLIFLIIKVIPGDPAQAILGERASQEAVQALRHQWGLDRPLWDQYFIYMQHLGHGDLGTSFRYKAEVMQLLPRRAGVTVFLVLYSTLLAVVVAIPLAVVSALNRDRWPDHVVRVVTTLPLASPVFWMGILFLLLFSLRLRWFPASGFGEGGFTDHLKHLFLPALTLSMQFMCLLTRNLRSGIIDVLQVTYVDFARAKGLSRSAIVVGHILRSALLSVVTLVGVHLAYAIGGAVITETIFALPGLGTFMVESIFSRDYQVVQSLTLMFALGTMVINLVTDLVYSVLDPRVRMD